MSLKHRIFAQNVRDMRLLPYPEVEQAGRVMLSRLLGHAARQVPFYRSKAAMLDAAASGWGDAWAALPLSTDHDLERLGADGLASELPDGEQALPDRRSWTSLSTPVEGPLGLLNDVADKAQWEYLTYSLGIDTAGRLAAILPDTAIQPGDLASAVEPWSIDAHQGPANRWSDRFEPETTLAWLQNIEPACLFADAGSVLRLLGIADPGRLALKEVLIWREAGRAGLAEACRRAFGARVVEAIASSVCGYIATADASGRFIPASETMFVEIVDSAGRPCGPGKPGRLVTSAIYSYVRPVIRHDLGLRAEWDQFHPISSERPRFHLLT